MSGRGDAGGAGGGPVSVISTGLEEVDPVWTVHRDGSRSFVPNNDAQRTLESTTAREVLYSGMLGSGKSVAMCFKLWRLCEYYDGAKSFILRRHYDHLAVSTLRILPRIFGQRMWERGLYGGTVKPEGFMFPNKSRMEFFGVSGDAERAQRMKSTEYAFGMADEVDELTESEIEMAVGRLRQTTVPFRQFIGGCNPNGPHHHLYRRFKIEDGPNRQWNDIRCPACQKDVKNHPRPPKRGCKACHGRGKLRRLQRELIMSGPHDNDASHDPEYLAWRDGLTGMRGKRYRDGLWVAYEGNVFEHWDPKKHVVDPPESWKAWDNMPPPDWPRVRGIDLGFDNPFCCSWFAISPDGKFYRYRELYRSLVTVPKLAKQMVELEALELHVLRLAAHRQGKLKSLRPYLEALNIVGSYCDWDRGEREQLHEAGISTDPAIKSIEPGIDMLIDMLNPDQPGGPKLLFIRGVHVVEDERLKFAKLPTCFEQEVPRYLWDENTAGTLAGRKKGIPIDRDNHAIDSVRYGVYSHLRRPIVTAY